MISEPTHRATDREHGVGLFVGSDETAAAALVAVGHAIGVDFVHVATAAEAFESFHDIDPSLVVIDCANPDLPPPVVTQQLRAAAHLIPIVALTADADRDTAQAGHSVADEVLSRSSDVERIRVVLLAALGRARRRTIDTAAAVDPERIEFLKTYGSVFRRGARSRALEEAVLRTTASDAPVLIVGESGVGKKTIARALHYLSARSTARWSTVSCSALAPDTLDVELFGLEQTGVDVVRPGRIELAQGGTVILEEFAELPLSVQAKIAHIVQAGRLYRVGGRAPVDVDVRIVATASKDLKALVATGRARRDLYDALADTTVDVPPLRDRAADIPGLAEFFRLNFMEHYRHDAPPLSAGLMDLLRTYHWPGNVLELQNLMKRCVALGDEANLEGELHTRSRSVKPSRPLSQRLPAGAVSLHDIGRKAAEEAEIAVILKVLEDVQWNRAEAARVLNISYKTLLSKLNRAGVAGRNRRLPQDP